MATMHSQSTIHEVFDAVIDASKQLPPLLRDLGAVIRPVTAYIKSVYISDDITIAEAELQAALRSALAFLEKAYSDAGPLLFFRRGSLGYDFAEVVRGLRNATLKAHAAGLTACDPTHALPASPSSKCLTRIEDQLRDETAHLFAACGGDLTEMLAACQHRPFMMSLLRALQLAEDPRGLIERRLTDDDASRHLFELHYDDVDMDMKQVTKKGRVCGEKVLIGRGAFGEVYKGRYLGVPVAVKEFPNETASIINTFEREVAILCALRHPNILPIIGFTRGDRAQDAKYTLVTPLLAQKFTDVIKDPSYAPERRLRWCVDIASALVYLHGREPAVRHGDLKPANVMLDPAGNAVLLDFGLATSSMTTTLHSRGGGFTPAYAAPEVQTGGARTAAADIFAFGLLLYEIWHGRPWYEGINLRGHASHVDFLRAGLTPPLSPPAMPAFMAPLITQCLATIASRRPSAAEVMHKFRIAIAPSAARADSLAGGDPTPFNPLPDGYEPKAPSAAAAFIAVMGGDPLARVRQLVDTIQRKTSSSKLVWVIALLAVIAIITSATCEFRSTKREPHLEGVRPRAIHIDETLPGAHYIMAWWLAAGENITIQYDRAVNEREVYLEAIRHDGTYSAAYNNLANCIATGKKVTLPDGRDLTKPLFVAGRHNVTYIEAYNNLANCLAAVNTSLFRMVVR
jgi:LIM domain kinase 1